MKVYLPAIQGYVPDGMVRTIHAFLEFCYITRKNIIDTNNINHLNAALDRFHQYREIFIMVGVRADFNLPRQHSLMHFAALMRAFGAPNGLCSSITESKHIKAVKEPWRRSNCYQATIQMMTTNTHLDKLVAMRADFVRRGMLPATVKPPDAATDEEEDADAVAGPCVTSSVQLTKKATRTNIEVRELAEELIQPNFAQLINGFLYEQLHPHSGSDSDSHLSAPQTLVNFRGTIDLYPSAQAIFYAPSDLCGTGGMQKELIRAVPSWYCRPTRYDTVFVKTAPDENGMLALDAARVRLFFSLNFRSTVYPCALVHWYQCIDNVPNDTTGMWVVQPEVDKNDRPLVAILHLDTILRASHLIPVFGTTTVPRGLSPAHSLDIFRAFYVNKFVDHHAFEIAF
ncbi:hypothetical protein HWV62_37567 [Athelia sp. TMB]|nr:hypothetical protein HWV62_37567 [Athelia sp. TMB]